MKISKQNIGWAVLILINVFGFSFLGLLLLLGAQVCIGAELYLQRVTVTDNKTPIFDLRRPMTFPLTLIFPPRNEHPTSSIEVYRIDETGRERYTCWLIEALPWNAPLVGVNRELAVAKREKDYPNFIEYGKVPLNWKQKVPPKGLEDGLYKIAGSTAAFVKNGEHYLVVRYLTPGKKLADYMEEAVR